MAWVKHRTARATKTLSRFGEHVWDAEGLTEVSEEVAKQLCDKALFGTMFERVDSPAEPVLKPQTTVAPEAKVEPQIAPVVTPEVVEAETEEKVEAEEENTDEECDKLREAVLEAPELASPGEAPEPKKRRGRPSRKQR